MLKTLSAAVLVVLALSGCSMAATPSATSLVEAVHRGWEGPDAPNERWIDTAAMLACKQIIGGIEPRVVMDHPANNEVVVAAAEQFLCERTRKS